jgi:hypothetical protein
MAPLPMICPTCITDQQHKNKYNSHTDCRERCQAEILKQSRKLADFRTITNAIRKTGIKNKHSRDRLGVHEILICLFLLVGFDKCRFQNIPK